MEKSRPDKEEKVFTPRQVLVWAIWAMVVGVFFGIGLVVGYLKATQN